MSNNGRIAKSKITNTQKKPIRLCHRRLEASSTSLVAIPEQVRQSRKIQTGTQLSFMVFMASPSISLSTFPANISVYIPVLYILHHQRSAVPESRITLRAHHGCSLGFRLHIRVHESCQSGLWCYRTKPWSIMSSAKSKYQSVGPTFPRGERPPLYNMPHKV